MAKKIAHLLKDNKQAEYPRYFIFFDTETLPKRKNKNTIEHKFRLGAGLFWRWGGEFKTIQKQWFDFTAPDKFWDWVVSKNYAKSQLVLIAHNLSFDMRVLKGFEALRKKGYKAKKLIIDYRINIWRFKKGDRTLLFLDNVNYFHTSLRSLGKDIGLEKLQMPGFDEANIIWQVYCRRDVEIIFKAWQQWLKFLKENNLGSFSPTLASQAFSAFRHRFMKHKIFIHPFEKATELEREGYHGGRCECFFIGMPNFKTFYNLDVNSMYPYVMKMNYYPQNLQTCFRGLGLTAFKRLLQTSCLVARVKLKTQEPAFPKKIDDKLCFPTGQFETVLTTRELQYAFDNNYIQKVLDVCVYTKAKLFTDYITFFYKKRQDYKKKGQGSFQYLCKLYLNTLYGKWGQKNDVFEEVGFDKDSPDKVFEIWNADKHKLEIYRIIGGTIEKSVGKVEGFNSFPAISAHVTADARLLLWDYILRAGKKNIFYCDTDSLFCNQQGFDNLKSVVNSHRLGLLKLQETSDYLEIRNLKDYTFGEVRKIKGIRKDAKEIAPNVFEQWQFEGMRGALRTMRLDKAVQMRITKHVFGDYNKGRVFDNGKVLPFQLCEK